MNTTTQLIKALRLIAKLEKKEVTAIQFEDGSGYKFNFQVNCGKWQFIDLTPMLKK